MLKLKNNRLTFNIDKNDFLEAARSSGAQTKQDKSSIMSNDGSIKKCNSAPTCKIEKKSGV